jgi:hypothetical protein
MTGERAVAITPPTVGVAGCDWPGCRADGPHRAPKSPRSLTSYFRFCVDHVRVYNRAWNYYAGMTDAEVEADLRNDVVWNRPTWPLGQAASRLHFAGGGVDDPFGFVEPGRAARSRNGAKRPHDRGGRPPARGSTEQAMAVLDLEPPLSAERLKARYKVLAKRHHPDANGGDKASEERIKQINHAYQVLRERLAP